jgi:hypothetical protein
VCKDLKDQGKYERNLLPKIITHPNKHPAELATSGKIGHKPPI